MITVNGHPFSFNIGAPLSRPLSLSPADIELCQWQQRQQQLRLVMGRSSTRSASLRSTVGKMAFPLQDHICFFENDFNNYLFS